MFHKSMHAVPLYGQPHCYAHVFGPADGHPKSVVTLMVNTAEGQEGVRVYFTPDDARMLAQQLYEMAETVGVVIPVRGVSVWQRMWWKLLR